MEIEPQDYAKNNYYHKRDAKEMVEEIYQEGIQNKIELILDIGCGNGDVTRILGNAFPSAKILASDILPSMINYSKAQLSSSESRRMDFVIQDFCQDYENWNEKIRNVEGKVDLIWSTYALHYAPLHKRQEIIKTLLKLLKPGGYLYINLILVRDFLPFLPPRLDNCRNLFHIPGLKRQVGMWRSYFKNLDVPMSFLNIQMVEKEWRDSRDDKHFKHYEKGSRTFINLFRPFIQQDLKESEKDFILNCCSEYVFCQNLLDTKDEQRMFAYDCVQIRGVK